MSKVESRKSTGPMVWPRCPVHDRRMSLRRDLTPGQEECGIWFACPVPDCDRAELFVSQSVVTETLADLAARIARAGR